MNDLRALVAEQADDEGLWFMAATAPEAYLQQELRRLHAAVESAATPEPTLDAERLADPEPIANETESGFARRRELVADARAGLDAERLADRRVTVSAKALHRLADDLRYIDRTLTPVTEGGDLGHARIWSRQDRRTIAGWLAAIDKAARLHERTEP